jgi:prepilin-type N-terminal cleavage/methylation domain-containing protein
MITTIKKKITAISSSSIFVSLKSFSISGMTMVEMMIALSIFTILAAITFSSISTFSKGFMSMDATNQMKSCSQSTVNKIGLRISECKRIFENTAQDTSFLARITGIDSPLSNSRLPKIEETGSLIPGDSLFTALSVGNSIFFANTEFPEIIQLSSTCATRIDCYVFNYYYLAQVSDYTIGNTPAIKLMEWHSKKYADYAQINVLSGNTKTLTIQRLYADGVTYAWDPAATIWSSAFYSLPAAGTAPVVQASHYIQKDTYEEMTRFARGVIWGKYRAGISPNTGGSLKTSQPVPKYALVSDNFPSGFEIAIVGPRSAHRIFIRLVLVAQGSSNLLVSNENSVLISVRNLW